VTRAAGTASPLRSRNNVFVGDRIETAEDSCVRLLLGGKAVLTVTDRSVVTIGEQPGVAIIDLGTGTIALSVARERLKAGDAIELRTPDAVAQIRGTILVAEVSANAGAAAGAPGRAASRFTALTGVVDVIPLDAARQRTSALTLPAVQTLAVRQGAPPDPPRALTPLEARSLFSSLRLRATPSPVPSYTAPPIPASTDWTLLIDRGRGFDAWRAPAAEGNVAGDDMLGGMTLASCEALAAALAGQGSRAACARSPWNYLEHPRPARHRDANDQLMATGPLAGKGRGVRAGHGSRRLDARAGNRRRRVDRQVEARPARGPQQPADGALHLLRNEPAVTRGTWQADRLRQAAAASCGGRRDRLP